ncbi:MAG: IS1380 family transposase [Pseudomonadota bacterium]
MWTQCSGGSFRFKPVGRREVVSAFDGGHVSSDAGVLLLREVADRLGMFRRLAGCFVDQRDARFTEHKLEALLAQRILGIACGYEDLNDHDHLRSDPAFAVAVGRRDVDGRDRKRARDKGCPLAGHATLNRIETAPPVEAERRRDHKICHRPEAIERLLVDLYLDQHPEPPEEIVLDLDATDDLVHGDQEGRFFHGYYRSYCFLPLYIFAGDHLLVAKLRSADQDGAAGSLQELERVVTQIRERWPAVRIVVRADSGFCRDWLLSWCEAQEDVDYVIGLARNSRLVGMLQPALDAVAVEAAAAGEPRRRYEELRYRTQKTWSRERRVVGKAEQLGDKSNPRFVVTSLLVETVDAQSLYADLYCARGDMENRIKEQQLGMFADRTSSHTMRANQLRLWFSSLAYVLVDALRRLALVDTQLSRAQVWTLRNRLLKIGAVVRVSVRRVVLSMASAFPLQDEFAQAVARLRGLVGGLA